MKFSRWQHALISFLILLGLVVLVYAACIQPAISYYQEKQNELQTQQDHLQRYINITSQKETLIPYYKKQINQNIDSQNFLPAMAPSLAAAKLQEQMKSLLEKNQGQLISTQPIPAQPEEIFTPIMIKVHIKSNTETLLKVLHNLESSRPLAFVENIQIQRVGRSGKKRNRLGSNRNINILNSRFDLKIYMLNKEVAPTL